MAHEIKRDARERTGAWEIYEAGADELLAHMNQRLPGRAVRPKPFDPRWVLDPEEPSWFQEAMERLQPQMAENVLD